VTEPSAHHPDELAEAVELGPRSRSIHLSPANIALVAAGGAIGTAVRYLITLVWPAGWSAPLAILLINVLGAFVLGLILETLVARGPDVGRRRMVRLGIGTGVLGGFTTYSTLAVDTVTLSLGHPVLGMAYGLGTVLVGAAASVVGIATARAFERRRQHGGSGDS
jgi:fluoride exporter